MNLIKATWEYFKKKKQESEAVNYKSGSIGQRDGSAAHCMIMSGKEVLVGNHMLTEIRGPFTIEHYTSCNLFFPKHNGMYIKRVSECYMEQQDISGANYLDSEEKAVNFCKMCDLFFKSKKIIDITI